MFPGDRLHCVCPSAPLAGPKGVDSEPPVAGPTTAPGALGLPYPYPQPYPTPTLT